MKTPNSKPTWQTERSAIALRICRRIQAAQSRGESTERAVLRASRYYSGRKYKSDPSRTIRLSRATLWRMWRQFKSCAESPAAFKLNYRSRPPFVPLALMLRFADYCATHRQPSIKAAWARFQALRSNIVLARGVSYQMVVYHFPAPVFRKMQAQLKAIETRETKLLRIKFALLADLTNRLPARPPRRRARPGDGYQI